MSQNHWKSLPPRLWHHLWTTPYTIPHKYYFCFSCERLVRHYCMLLDKRIRRFFFKDYFKICLRCTFWNRTISYGTSIKKDSIYLLNLISARITFVFIRNNLMILISIWRLMNWYIRYDENRRYYETLITLLIHQRVDSNLVRTVVVNIVKHCYNG